MGCKDLLNVRLQLDELTNECDQNIHGLSMSLVMFKIFIVVQRLFCLSAWLLFANLFGGQAAAG